VVVFAAFGLVVLVPSTVSLVRQPTAAPVVGSINVVAGLLFVLLVLPAVASLLGAPWRELLALVPSWWIVRTADAMNDGGRWFPLVLGSAAVNLLIAGAAVACGAGGPALLRPFSRPASRSPARVSPGSR